MIVSTNHSTDRYCLIIVLLSTFPVINFADSRMGPPGLDLGMFLANFLWYLPFLFYFIVFADVFRADLLHFYSSNHY